VKIVREDSFNNMDSLVEGRRYRPIHEPALVDEAMQDVMVAIS
jgi:hypothetical protein